MARGEETVDNSLVLSLTVEDVSGGGGHLTTRLHYGRLPGSKLSGPASRGSHLDGVAVCEVGRHQALTAPVPSSVWTYGLTDILTDRLTDQPTRLLEFHMLYGTKNLRG